MSVDGREFAWAAIEAEDLSPGERLVLLVIGDHLSDETGLAWPGNRTIAKRSGLSLGGVRHAIARLEDRGLVKTIRGAGRTPTHYRLPIDADRAQTDVARGPERAQTDEAPRGLDRAQTDPADPFARGIGGLARGMDVFSRGLDRANPLSVRSAGAVPVDESRCGPAHAAGSLARIRSIVETNREAERERLAYQRGRGG